MPLAPVNTMTAPRQKNWVPMVATSDGTPMRTTITPLRAPATKARENACNEAEPRALGGQEYQLERRHAERHDRREGKVYLPGDHDHG